MGIFGTKQYLQGFTIVELIIAVIVIGILATIGLVGYPNYQKRVLDSERKSDVSQISAALTAYAQQKNSYVGISSGCGVNGNGNGWFNAGPGEIASYPKAIATCLQEANLLNNSVFNDPTGCKWNSGGSCGTYQVSPVRAYMKISCTKNSSAVTYVLAYLETEPRKDAEVNALCDNNSVSGFTPPEQNWGTNYGMNYYVMVK